MTINKKRKGKVNETTYQNLRKLLIEHSFTERSPDYFEAQFPGFYGYNEVSITIYKSKNEAHFYGRCYPIKEGWMINHITILGMLKLMRKHHKI